MNIDEFIFPEQAGSPSAFASPQMPSMASTATGGQPSSIPIQQQPRSEGLGSAFVPQSVPDAPHHQHRGNSEFNYVQRRVRKTSIDERQVRFPLVCTRHVTLPVRAFCFSSLTCSRRENVLPTFLPTSALSARALLAMNSTTMETFTGTRLTATAT